jgi:hypothetical protein
MKKEKTKSERKPTLPPTLLVVAAFDLGVRRRQIETAS